MQISDVPKPLSERLNLSVSPDLLADLDEWRHVQLDIPGRAEAARRLLEAALRATRRAKGKGEAPGAS
jgi:hypothetical protein